MPPKQNRRRGLRRRLRCLSQALVRFALVVHFLDLAGALLAARSTALVGALVLLGLGRLGLLSLLGLLLLGFLLVGLGLLGLAGCWRRSGGLLGGGRCGNGQRKDGGERNEAHEGNLRG
ncbi:MAG: hypothetical protein FJX55_06185 [Alphaproteobacteria bacterium]|nr:hypothetical protein [Alphaproteobacteria bacterium]